MVGMDAVTALPTTAADSGTIRTGHQPPVRRRRSATPAIGQTPIHDRAGHEDDTALIDPDFDFESSATGAEHHVGGLIDVERNARLGQNLLAAAELHINDHDTSLRTLRAYPG